MLDGIFKRRKKVQILMKEYLVGEVRDDGSAFHIWIRAQDEDEAIRIYRWLTDSTGDYFVAASRPSRCV